MLGARKLNKLSAAEVSNTKGPAVLHDGGGLYLRVSSTGTKSWVFRFQIKGKRRDMGLGPFPDVTLARAREKAAAHRAQSCEGADPIDAKRAERQAQHLVEANWRTFREVAEEYIARNEAAWRRAEHRQQWRNTLATYVYPAIGDLPVAAVDAGLVVQLLDPIWATKPETASRVRWRIEAVLDAATVLGYRQGANPARWKGNLAHLLPARSKVQRIEHYAALPYQQLAAFMIELRGRNGIAARSLEFTILTAARSGEVRNARWSEIDFSERVRVIPAESMKYGREHRIPLSDAAIVILKQMQKICSGPYVFHGLPRAPTLSNGAMTAVLQRMGRPDLTAHGFRSTFRDWVAECTDFPREAAELSLAHIVGGKVERAYWRGDMLAKRRELMDAWADFAMSYSI